MAKDRIGDDFQYFINWYPGHMAKATRNIKENAKLADLFVVVLDARCPISSYNEDFDHIAPQKPRLFIITKSDLMDKSKKDKINQRFKGSKILWLDLRQRNSRKIILQEIKKLLNEKIQRDKAKGLLQPRLKSFVVGIPNAGKSSLINLVSQKSSLKVANYPGVTLKLDWVRFDEFWFLDTPGILLPKYIDQEMAGKLLSIGSIKIDKHHMETSAFIIYSLISKYYPNKIEELGVIPASENAEIYGQLIELSYKKSFLVAQGKPDLDKTYQFFIHWAKTLTGVTYD